MAPAIQSSGPATLLFDLLTRKEKEEDAVDGRVRFDRGLLVRRLIVATDWVAHEPVARHLGIGYFRTSTGGAAGWGRLPKPSQRFRRSCYVENGRDLAGSALPWIEAPTLLIVGERDDRVVELNQDALAQLRCSKKLVIVSRATHLFEERGVLDRVAIGATLEVFVVRKLGVPGYEELAKGAIASGGVRVLNARVVKS